jgi:hypothetical protein
MNNLKLILKIFACFETYLKIKSDLQIEKQFKKSCTYLELKSE